MVHATTSSSTVRGSVRVIATDEEAIAVAEDFAWRIRERAVDRDQQRQLPFEEMALYSRSGLGGITVPREFGGADVSVPTVVEVFRIVSAADPSIGQIPQTHFGAINSIKTIGDEAQQSRFFAAVLRGERFGSATSERGTKNARDLVTRLSYEQGSYVLNGTKFYCTGSLFARWLQVLALDEQGQLARVLVPRDAHGVSVSDDWTGFGQRTTGSGTVMLTNVVVDPQNILPAYKLYGGAVTLQGPFAQIIQAAIDAGIAEEALKDTEEFVRTKTRPWIDSGLDVATADPLMLREIGLLHLRVNGANALLRRAARQFSLCESPLKEADAAAVSIGVAEAKAVTTEAALIVAEKLHELSGSHSSIREHGLDRHWRNARTHTLHDPVRWKYNLVGNYYLNGVHPDRHSFV
ncbi:SfnB family sulfur acquisition oxidoreductase [Pseudomonas helleri]|uniref:SfnB family sulfur acquisition oxidoreductase n=1 Tax=Pseudomonas helleri TaxID=1608996 RepID=UPI003DA74810